MNALVVLLALVGAPAGVAGTRSRPRYRAPQLPRRTDGPENPTFLAAPRPTEAPSASAAAAALLARQFTPLPDTCGFIDGVFASSWWCSNRALRCTDNGKYIGCCPTTGDVCDFGLVAATCADYPAISCKAGVDVCCRNAAAPSCFTLVLSGRLTGFGCTNQGPSLHTLLVTPTDLPSTTSVAGQSSVGVVPSSTLSPPTTSTPSSSTTSDADTSASPSETSTTTSSSSTSTPASAASSTSGQTTPVGAIVGGAVGGLAVVVIGVVGVLYVLTRRKRNRAGDQQPPPPQPPYRQHQHQQPYYPGYGQVSPTELPSPYSYSNERYELQGGGPQKSELSAHRM